LKNPPKNCSEQAAGDVAESTEEAFALGGGLVFEFVLEFVFLLALLLSFKLVLEFFFTEQAAGYIADRPQQAFALGGCFILEIALSEFVFEL
jgi:hypothetical protein